MDSKRTGIQDFIPWLVWFLHFKIPLYGMFVCQMESYYIFTINKLTFLKTQISFCIFLSSDSSHIGSIGCYWEVYTAQQLPSSQNKQSWNFIYWHPSIKGRYFIFVIPTAFPHLFLIFLFWVFKKDLFCTSQDLIATGGVDMNAVVFNRSSGEIVSTLSGHSKKVFFTIW